jgi:rRNA processing protein Krr1/Pno1
MQTVTIDIINDKAMKLLQDLEMLDIIRLHKDEDILPKQNNPLAKYKGKMTKQPIAEIEKQLKELRDSWE